MIKDDIIKVKTCVLKVGIHCPACVKQVKKIVHKVDGVYQSTVERDGKVTVSGLMDPDMVIKKLKKAGKSAQLWGPEPQMGSQAQLGSSSGGDQQPKDGDEGQGNAGADARSSGETQGAAKDAIPQATPQQLLREQIMKELMLPSQPKGMSSNGKTSRPTAAAPPVKNSKAFRFNDPEEEEEFEDDGELDDDGFEGEDFFEDDGLVDNDAMPIAMTPTTLAANKRGGSTTDIPVLAKGKAKIAGEVVPAVKPKNGGSVQLPSNGKAIALGGGNKPGLANKVAGRTSGLPSGAGGSKMGGTGMPPQQPGMMPRPPYMMGGGAPSYPGMLQMGGMPMGHPQMVGNGGMQPGGGSAAVHGMMAGGSMMPGGGFCQGGASGGGGVAGGMPPSGPEQYMPMVPQQQPQMMMNGHGPHGCYHCHHAHGGGGYPPAYYYPPMPRHPHDNMFSDENPNSYCSLM